MNNIESFNNLNKWINDVNLYNKLTPIVKYLIANKSDLECKIPYSDINLLLINNNLQYYVNSNLLENNIYEIFNNIISDIYRIKYKSVYMPNINPNINRNINNKQILDQCC